MKGKYLSVLIALCGLASASTGICINTGGLFYKPIASDLNVGIGAVSLTMTILTVASSFTALIVPRILKEKTLKPIILTSMVLIAAGTFLMAIAHSTWVLYIASVLRGLGSGMTSFVLVTSILNNWYYKQHGLITSIALSFSGIPGVILSPILTSLINSQGWRFAMMTVAALVVVMMLPGVLWGVTIRPETQSLEPYGYADFLKEKEKGNIRVIRTDQSDFSYLTKEFFLAVMFMILVCIAAPFPNYMPAFAESVNLASITGIILSVTLAGNILSKIFFGMICDRFGARISIVMFAGISLTALLVLLWHGNAFAVLAAALLFNFTAANSSVGVSIITSDLFGEANYSKAYPMLSFIGSYAMAFSSALIGFLYDAAGSYTPVLMLVVVIQALVIAVTLLAYQTKHAVSS